MSITEGIALFQALVKGAHGLRCPGSGYDQMTGEEKGCPGRRIVMPHVLTQLWDLTLRNQNEAKLWKDAQF